MKIQSNPIKTRQEWEAQREAAKKDPGTFHGEIAKKEIFWFLPERKLWAKKVHDKWLGYDLKGTKVDLDLPASFNPWEIAFDDRDPPFYRWFQGGFTNACFNEVDSHVWAGHGDEIAFIFEGDRWNPSLNGEKGGPVVQKLVTRKELLWEVVKCACVLKNLGLKQGDRIALNMPNILEQIYFTEAAKRLGVIYTPVFGGLSAKTLADRIQDAEAKVVITVDGAHRNAEVIPFKEVFTDKALDDYIPMQKALETILKTIPSDSAQIFKEKIGETLRGEITVERSDVMHVVGKALEGIKQWDATKKSKIRTLIAEALVKIQSPVKTVVVQLTKTPDISWNTKRDLWAHELLEATTKRLLEKAQKKKEAEILAMPHSEFIEFIEKTAPPVIVDAEFPLFIMYTSGSTGKPKGVVHTHGGYIAGIAHTMRVVFDINPEALKPDVIYVVADPGWITGQSYMISAALTTRTTSVITEGSPLFPNAGRFASIIERYKVNHFKAGSTFLKTIITDPQHIADIQVYDLSSLKVGTFCAEPTNPTIQTFAMELLTPHYINSYWATEHGGIVLSHFYGNLDFKLKPDAHAFPLPWIFADVWIAKDSESEKSDYRIAEYREKGEIVITQPFPYLARTIWGDAENVGKSSWKGDFERFKKIYYSHWPVWAYTQGDYACKYEDGSMSLHGRSDDVINTSGHRIGTEEIERAILKDKQINAESPIRNVIVVGAPHKEKGTVPLAFILTEDGKPLSLEIEKRLISLVREEKGAVAVPAGFISVSQFPETNTGKYMRRFLRNMLEGNPLGDISTLKNPASLRIIEEGIQAWRKKMDLKERQTILETHSTLRVEYHLIKQEAFLSILTIRKPPVNALNEHALDELNTVIEHLSRRSDIKVIILTGAGTKSFIAGADIRQFLEEMYTLEDVLPLPNKANLAIHALETLDKPVIAAVNGLALGGGNEFQMAAHYRIAESTAKFGQTEILLHLIPGYGGTQRLPRLLSNHLGEERGLIEAAEMILGGRMISAEKALRIGLIDEISSPIDALSRAVELGREYILNPDTSILGKAHQKRLLLNVEWEKPKSFPSLFTKDPEVIRLIEQAEYVGRQKPLQKALEALQYGYENGITKGLQKESILFAESVIDPKMGKFGIQAFYDKKAAPLPVRSNQDLQLARDRESFLIESGELLSIGTPFYPGVTPIPKYQYAHLVEKDRRTGVVNHGDPIHVENLRINPVEHPRPNQALLYMLTSEINFNDLWAITGIPVSPFENHDEDWHVTGSGGLALVVEIGSELKEEGRIKVGDLVAIFSGQSQLLAPIAGLDPMFADQKIQGYETPDGSHQQFMLVQGPQIFHKLPDLSCEASGCYMLNLGTIYRALFNTLKIETGKNLFIEGAATGTGLEAVKIGVRQGLHVTGLVSNEERAQVVRQKGAVGTLNRHDPKYKHLFTKVPENSSEWEKWEKEGEILLEAYKAQNQGKLADYVVSHAGEISFPRSYQLLGKEGILTFFGASTGYHFTFMGKSGTSTPEEMLKKAKLVSGEAVLIWYGVNFVSLFDQLGLEAIEVAKEFGASIVVCTQTEAQTEFVTSMGYGECIKGVFSIEELHRHGGDFTLPQTMPSLPNPKANLEIFKQRVRWYQENVFKPFATRVGKLLQTAEKAFHYPDLVIERSMQDTLALSSMLVKPYTGRVIYVEEMSKRRYSFYAPQVWMRQRRIYMPSSSIFGTHLSNAYEIQALNELINSGFLTVDEPEVIEFMDLSKAHQEMWENKHRAANYVLNHALPQKNLKSKEDLYHAWSLRENDSF